MPVFDFKHTPDEKKAQECTYTTFRSNETEATAEKPMLVLDNTATGNGSIIPVVFSPTRLRRHPLNLTRKMEL